MRGFSVSQCLTRPGGGFPLHNRAYNGKLIFRLSAPIPARTHPAQYQSQVDRGRPFLVFHRTSIPFSDTSYFYCSLRCCSPKCLHWTALSLLPTKKRSCRRGSYAVPLLLRQWLALASSSGGNCAFQTWRVHSHVPPRHAAYYSSLTLSPWTLCKALLHSTGGSLETTAMVIAVLHRTPHVLSLTYMSIRAYILGIVPQDMSSLGT